MDNRAVWLESNMPCQVFSALILDRDPATTSSLFFLSSGQRSPIIEEQTVGRRGRATSRPSTYFKSGIGGVVQGANGAFSGRCRCAAACPREFTATRHTINGSSGR